MLHYIEHDEKGRIVRSIALLENGQHIRHEAANHGLKFIGDAEHNVYIGENERFSTTACTGIEFEAIWKIISANPDGRFEISK